MSRPVLMSRGAVPGATAAIGLVSRRANEGKPLLAPQGFLLLGHHLVLRQPVLSCYIKLLCLVLALDHHIRNQGSMHGALLRDGNDLLSVLFV